MRGDGGGFEEGEGTKGNPSLMLQSLCCHSSGAVCELCASACIVYDLQM